MFGDYYWFSQSHRDQVSPSDPTPIRTCTACGFGVYFTYEYAYSAHSQHQVSARGKQQRRFHGRGHRALRERRLVEMDHAHEQQLTLGIQPTLTFDWLDEFWGLRHIEKSPADLSPRFLARLRIHVQWPLGPCRARYAAQFGNESGSGSETQEGKILRFESRYERKPGIALEGFYSFSTRAEGEHRHTAQGIAGFRSPTARVGGQYLWQVRKPGPDLPNQEISVWSGFAVWERPNRADLFFRVDAVTGDLGGVETGLLGAEEIDYWLLSSQSPFTMWIGGGEALHPSVRLGPNLELVRYSKDPDAVNFPDDGRIPSCDSPSSGRSEHRFSVQR